MKLASRLHEHESWNLNHQFYFTSMAKRDISLRNWDRKKTFSQVIRIFKFPPKKFNLTLFSAKYFSSEGFSFKVSLKGKKWHINCGLERKRRGWGSTPVYNKNIHNRKFETLRYAFIRKYIHLGRLSRELKFSYSTENKKNSYPALFKLLEKNFFQTLFGINFFFFL